MISITVPMVVASIRTLTWSHCSAFLILVIYRSEETLDALEGDFEDLWKISNEKESASSPSSSGDMDEAASSSTGESTNAAR